MEMYKLLKMDEFECVSEERYFKRFEKASKAFDDEIEKYKADKNLASDQDVAEHYIADVNLEVTEQKLFEKQLKSAIAVLWGHYSSQEGQEWSIYVERLILEKIEVE